MSYGAIMLVLSAHFIGDFILQSDWMAQNKSRRLGCNKHMAAHIAVYAACLLPFGGMFAALNAAAHWVTDTITSNATSYLWKHGKRHWFFVVIGADQLAHHAVLFWLWGVAT